MSGTNSFVFRVELQGGEAAARDLRAIDGGLREISSSGATVAAPGLRTIKQDADQASASLGGLASSAGSAKAALLAMVAAGGVTAAIVGIGRSALESQMSAAKLNATLTYVAGSAGGAAAEMEYLRRTAFRLGVDFTTSAAGYAKLAAATKESGISAATTRALFEGMAKASTHMGLSAEETNGALLALSQIASKGTVSAEELRGQLGERLAGALAIAARAMGVTEAQLGKMLEKGEIAASDFLPRFAQALNDKFANPVDNVVSNVNRLSSAWDLFKQSLFAGDGSGGLGRLTAGLNESSAAMRKLGAEANIVHRVLLAIGAFGAGALGKSRDDLLGVQKRLMTEELPDLKRQIAELEAKKSASAFGALNYLETGKLTELKARAADVRGRLFDLASEIGKSSGEKIMPEGKLKAEFEAARNAAKERLKGYLDSTKNETAAVKLAGELDEENRAFQKATAGFAQSSKEYADALAAHQRRVAEIQAKAAPKGGGAGRVSAGIDPERERVALQRQRMQEAAEELRRVEAHNRAVAVMDATVGKLGESYQRQRAIYGERGMTEAQRELAESLRRVSEAADGARESLSAKAASLAGDDITALEAYREALVRVGDLEAQQIEAVRAHQAEQQRLNGLWQTGAGRAFQVYQDGAKSAAKQAEDAFARAFSGMEDALVTFVTTGKLSFREFAASLIADIARIEIKSTLSRMIGGGVSGGAGGSGLGGLVGPALQLAGSFFGLGGAGVAGNLAAVANGYQTMNTAAVAGMFFDAAGAGYGPGGRVERFANGGAFTNRVFNRPTLFQFARGGGFGGLGVMGEAGDEAVMPLSRDMLGRDSRGRLGVRRGIGGGGPVINVHVSGATANQSQIRTSAGKGAREALALLNGARAYG